MAAGGDAEQLPRRETLGDRLDKANRRSDDRTLHASGPTLELIVAGYGTAYAAMLVLGGRLGDRHGRHRLFGGGLITFILASLACGLAPTIWVLIGARIVQGAAAAMLVPQVLATVHATLEGERKARALALYGATSGLAAVVGQLGGGILVNANIAGTTTPASAAGPSSPCNSPGSRWASPPSAPSISPCNHSASPTPSPPPSASSWRSSCSWSSLPAPYPPSAPPQPPRSSPMPDRPHPRSHPGATMTTVPTSLTSLAGLDTVPELAAQLRVDSVRSSTSAGSGHPTSSCSPAREVASADADLGAQVEAPRLRDRHLHDRPQIPAPGLQRRRRSHHRRRHPVDDRGGWIVIMAA
jgi:hypothetical protein